MNRFRPLARTAVAVTLLLPVLAGSGLQASFAYNPGDLLMGLRRSGAATDITANLGPVTNYLGLPPGTSIAITNLLPQQITAAFTDLGDVSWSAFSAVRTNGNPDYPGGTLWITAPRTDVGLQSDPWVRKSRITQGNTESVIYAIGNDAFLFGNSVPSSPENTSTGIQIPSGDPFSYGTLMTSSGNFRGTFQGSAENTTPVDFVAAGSLSRSDFYQLEPGSAASLNTPGTYLGYFDFKPDGTLAFTAAGGPSLPPPTITQVVRSAALSTVSFTTVSGATYTLRYTNSAGLTASPATWSPVPGSVTGTGAIQSLQDTSTDADRFYVIVVVSTGPGVSPGIQLAESLPVNSR